jgi:ribosomal protein S18 acetylase RimI-like enzyme
MVIRDLRPDDLPVFLALLNAKAQFDGAESYNCASVEKLHNAFFGERPSVFALVAETDGEVVAMATYYTVFSLYLVKPSIWLNDLFVHPDWRNKQIGPKLLARLSEIAIANGCARIDWIVATTNTKGQAFYRRLGAEIFDAVKLARFNDIAIRGLSKMAPG